MEKLSTIAPMQLTWAKTGDGKFELRAIEKVYATIKWAKSDGSLATGETSEGIWTFKRAGFFKPFVTVRLSGNDTNLATLKPGSKNESRLEFAGKQTFIWKANKARRREMGFFDAYDRMVVGIATELHLNSYLMTIEDQPDKYKPEEFSVLLLMGCYLNVLNEKDQEMAAVIVATSTITLNPG